ncbi:hypothetical protein GQB15_003232 [Salmonella enterica]|nr:hypothetical protein [Salmonella enterica]
MAFWFHSVILRKCVIGADIFKIKLAHGKGSYFLFHAKNSARKKAKFREKEEIFLFHQGKGKKPMAKEWFTVKECLGLPGFPGSEPAVRERLYKYSEGR